MPDLTVEYYWVCQALSDYAAAHPYEYGRDAEFQPPCDWQQFVEGGEPVQVGGQLRCPKCGRPVVTQGYGV